MNENTVRIESDFTFVNHFLNRLLLLKDHIRQGRALNVIETILETSGVIQERYGYDVSDARIDIIPGSIETCIELIERHETPLLRLFHEAINTPLDDDGKRRLAAALIALNNALSLITVADAYRAAGLMLAARVAS
jgi:hypothetical protein